ncbi:uncharacterized protein LOC130528921 isoform X1 [Takifugu flavidus]|uniref:uncharacterized protein LOC130528921 isoform X1 n=2 Tax=Takifugu flavidus TaxID=433684 RepID=UPI002544BAD5|nr:uncharacterized protein LOC130528921 isoform X1 [Takifugu flavidus]
MQQHGCKLPLNPKKKKSNVRRRRTLGGLSATTGLTMWERSSRSSALERAESLLTSYKNQTNSSKTWPHSIPIQARLDAELDGLDDLSSVSSGGERTNTDAAMKPQTAVGTSSEREIPATPKEVVKKAASEEEEEEEEWSNYQSDFVEASTMEQDSSQISEQLQQQGHKEDLTEGKDDANYSRHFSDDCYSVSSATVNHTCPTNSRSTSPCRSQSSCTSRRPSVLEKILKEAAVQTQPYCLADTHNDGIPGMAVIELLKYKLSMTRTSIERSQDLYYGLMRSLEPPNYRYITLAQLTRRNHGRELRVPGSTRVQTPQRQLQDYRNGPL